MAVTPPPTGSSPTAGGVAAGTVLGARYRIDEKLASGGMAQVWRGTDEVLRRAVAIKVLHPHLAADDTFVERFRREAIAAARLSHPAIVNVYDTCSDDGLEAIIMELVGGVTLRQRLDDGPMDPWRAASIAAQVAGALEVAHASGLVHRDIKPANILLTPEGRVKVGDFGIAKAAESGDITQEGTFLGTAKYLAPEQVEGLVVDGRTDLYSLGVVLYEMLCGRVPFEADGSTATALARLHHSPPRPRLVRAGIPRPLEAITMRLLEREPKKRYPTATDLRGALFGAGADDAAPTTDTTMPDDTAPGTSGVPTTPGTTPVRFRDSERRWLVPTLMVVLVAASLAVAGLLLGQGSELFDHADPTTTTSTEPEPVAVPVVSTDDFDPEGEDREEHSDEAENGNAVDGNRETSWSTSTYETQDWGALKAGVGLVLELSEPTDLVAVEVDSPSAGWAAEIYVADNPGPDSLEEWGEPVGSVDPAASSGTSIEVAEARGGAVLLWLTRAGSAALDQPGQHRVQVDEIRVLSRPER